MPGSEGAGDIGHSVLMVCAADGARTHLGTAWVCGPGMAVTAWHVVQDLSQVVLKDHVGTESDARLMGFERGFDIAVLSFRSESLDAPALKMNDDGDWRQGDSWSGYGHPIGFPSGFPVDGTVSSPGFLVDGYRRISLNCEQGPKSEIRGLSGAPVCDSHGAVIGLLTGYPDNLAQVTLFATRLDDAWRAVAEWRAFMPSWRSGGSVSQYLAQQQADWDRPTHRQSFRQRERKLSAIFIAPRFRAPRNMRQTHEAMDGNHAADLLLESLRLDGRVLVLRGDPGTGKSVLLRWLAAQAAADWLSRRSRVFVPVMIHASQLARTDCHRAMREALGGHVLVLPAGTCWLLLIDGLDEMVDIDERRRVMAQLRQHASVAADFDRAPLKMVLASRPLAILDELSPTLAQHFVLQPFSSSQLESFAHGWFNQDTQHSLAQAFLDEVTLSRLEGLTSIPALATMAAVVFECSPNRTLPRRRSDLYDRFIELMLKERAQQAWDSFEQLAQQLYPGQIGRELASHLWNARLELSTLLALDIQEGRISLASDAFGVHATLLAQKAGLLEQARQGSLASEQQVELITDLLRNSGLFVDGQGGRLEFFHNTLREAMVAQALSREVPPQAEQMWPLVSRWSEPRWREIVLIALSRWSEQGDSARMEAWVVLKPVMYTSRRGLQFAGMAIAEGMQLPPECESEVTAELFSRLGAWNPCSEIFSEFTSPNPLDVLQLLTRREHFVELLLTEMRQNPEKCRIRIWAFLELTLDQGCIGQMREFLDYEDDFVKLAAALLLTRSGAGADVVPYLLTALHSGDLDQKDRRRIAQTVAEHAPRYSLQQLLGAGELPVDIRLVAAATGWRRYRDDDLIAQAQQLLGFSQLDPVDTDDQMLARLVLGVPGIAMQRPRIRSTCQTVLAALCNAAGSGLGMPDWVRTICMDLHETPTMRVLASACILHAEPDDEAALACALYNLRDPEMHRQTLAVLTSTFASLSRTDCLDAMADDTALPIATRFAALLAVPTLDAYSQHERIEALLSEAATGGDTWWECLRLLAGGGQVELAGDYCVGLVLAGGHNSGALIRELMDMGCSARLVQLIGTKGLNPISLNFAIRCLGQMGDARQLLGVAQNSDIPPSVRLHAASSLRELGWLNESGKAKLDISKVLGESPERELMELEKYAMALEVAQAPWPASILAEMAGETQEFSPLWEKRLQGLLEQPGLAAADAISLMKVLGGKAPLPQVFRRCQEEPGDGECLLTLADFALDKMDLPQALMAVAEAVRHPLGRCYSSARILYACADRIGLDMVSTCDRSASDRMYSASEFARRGWLTYKFVAAWTVLARDKTLPVAERLAALHKVALSEFADAQTRKLLVQTVIEHNASGADPPVLFEIAMQTASLLAQAGLTRQARAIGRNTLRTVTYDLENPHCVQLVFILARCDAQALVQEHLREIAEQHSELSTRLEAAILLTTKKQPASLDHLGVLCTQDVLTMDPHDVPIRARAIEVLLAAGAWAHAGRAALELAQACGDDLSDQRGIFQGLWGRSILEAQSCAPR